MHHSLSLSLSNSSLRYQLLSMPNLHDLGLIVKLVSSCFLYFIIQIHQSFKDHHVLCIVLNIFELVLLLCLVLFLYLSEMSFFISNFMFSTTTIYTRHPHLWVPILAFVEGLTLSYLPLYNFFHSLSFSDAR